MKMSTVYRVENPEGSGMYNCGAFWSARDRVDAELQMGAGSYSSGVWMRYTVEHPGPENDGIDTHRLRGSHKFGFGNLDQMFAWIGPYMRALQEDGRVDVFEFEVPEQDILRGRRQVAFIDGDGPRVMLEWDDLINQYEKIKETAA